MENSNAVAADVHNSSTTSWPTNMKELVDPKGPFIPKWNVVFLVACLFSVLLDPFFLYIPVINDDIKCVRLDDNLKIAALVLRSATDLCYLLNIFFQVYSYSTNSSALHWRISLLPNIANTMWRSYILIDILAVLPIPQIIILIFYFKMRGCRSFGTRKLMNFIVLVHYVPRVFRIYLSCKDYSKKSSKEEIPIWLKGVLNFFLYILASHVIGAFWYFFAVQQITTCWQHACRPENGCAPNNLYCHDHHALRNIKFLDELCSVDPPNEKLFNFGIFLDILQLGILGSTNYFEKFSNCFCWGLRNLSSLGSNLNPSINAWENTFVAFISIIGLLLFLYLIGNLQTYMQLDTARLETHRWKTRIAKKMEKKGQEVQRWLFKNGIPSSIKSEIMVKVEVELKENKDVNVENILSILPSYLQSYIKSRMPLSRLKQVPLLENMDEGVLKAISEYLKPEKYTKNDIIIREKEPLQMMIFIVSGLVTIKLSDCSRTMQLSAETADKVYGEKLLTWPAWTSFPSVYPVATESLRADGDVEALVLMASDMVDLGLKFKSNFLNKGITRLTDDEWELLESDRVSVLKKVRNLETMNTSVLKAISENLKPMNCDGCVITEGKPLGMMVFAMSGSISLKKEGDIRSEKRQFYGEELLDWVLDTSFPAIVPISTHGVFIDNANNVLVLTAKDLGGVVSNFKSHFSKEITIPTDSSSDLCAIVGLTWLKRGTSIFQHMDEEVLKVISKHLKLMSYSEDTYVVRENEPLENMFIFVGGSSMSTESAHRPFKVKSLGIGDFYGEDLVYWVTNWTASHTNFPDKLPSSTSEVKVGIDNTGNAGVLVLSADDLKSIVSEFRWHFFKQTALPVNSEGKLSTFDPLATLSEVPELQAMDQKTLEEIHRSLIPMRYNNTPLLSPKDEMQRLPELDKMVLIVSGVASLVGIEGGEREYSYLGAYVGNIVLKGLRPNGSFYTCPDWFEAVGEVEALILRGDALIRFISELTYQKKTDDKEHPSV
ncbi:hypothetical protein M0R45_037127 [Rubus argutus]|uniref:Cyclic nucleotide-binding domain-containing protein n=1 Tax=Rubus argutus TaxID=59490 RepID=A0AAW1VZR8_RUBAR